MRRLLPLLAMLVFAAVAPAWADDLSIPGLDADAQAYASSLKSRIPAGLTPQARDKAEERAAIEAQLGHWPAAVTALETRLGGGRVDPQLWLDLAHAQLVRTPPNPARAAQAAWEAFGLLDDGPAQIPALRTMTQAFSAMNRPDAAMQAMQAVVDRAPDDHDAAAQLAALRREAGILVKQVHTEQEADPPQACIVFTSPPARQAGFVASDWVTLSPAQPNTAISRQGDQICVAGLHIGATTTVTLREGLPGEGGIKLNRATTLRIAMPNRKPRLVFDSRMFLLPTGQAATITLTSVNLSKVKLKLLRLSERTVLPWSRDNAPGQVLDRSVFDSATDNGKIVWQGTADLPQWKPNVLLRTALPLPDAFQQPGAYLLLATPGDGTPEYDASATQIIMRTDLAPTVWRGTDGLTVQVRSFADGTVQPGVELRLLARSNDILATQITDAQGVARFPVPLLRGTGPQAPQSIHAMQAGAFVSLDLTTAAFDLSDRGVAGRAQPGPLDAFAWTDRGIYRPGETVQLMALLRDAAGQSEDVPAHVVVKRPNGQVFLNAVPARGPDASIHLPIVLSAGAPAGDWTVELLADPKRPPIGRATFRVDAFVPDRMAVDLTPGGPIAPGKPYDVPVTARFLYGAPAAGLTGSASLNLVIDPAPPPALAGYHVGLEHETFAPDAQTIPLPMTDAQGHATLPIRVTEAPDTTHPVMAKLDVAVNDPSGRASHTHVTIPVRAPGLLIGIKPLFAGAIDADTEAAFDIAAVDPDGHLAGTRAHLRLVRERPDWHLVRHGEVSSYEISYREEPISAADITLTPGTPFHFAQRLGFGRYRIEVTQTDGLAATSVWFRSGWVESDSPDTPDKVDVSTDRKSYAVGDVAHVHIVSPFAGHATLLMLTDRVQSLRDLDIPTGGTDVDVKVDAAWGPGAYATVHVFRGPDASDARMKRPARAIGLVWLGVDPAARTLALSIDAPDKVLPRQPATIAVHTAPSAWVTLATVDEGVLRLTGFKTPDPISHFLGRRKLGLDIRDDWGRLIAPGEGEATKLHQGGDSGPAGVPEIPQKVVSLFTPPVQAGPDGVARIAVDLPDFNGQLRLMAVAWQGSRIAAADRDMIVRDPLIAEPLLPRFLAPGDEARLAVMLQDLDLPPGEATATLSVTGPLVLAGETTLRANLVVGQRVLRATTLQATGAGAGTVHMVITGPSGFHAVRDQTITVRPSRAAISLATATSLAPQAETTLLPAFDRMIPGTATARATFGGPVRYDVAALLTALRDYPLSCLEQTSSRGFPLALLPDGALVGPDREGRLQTAVSSVLDRQRYDGGFGLWSANDEAETWLSAYATEFLLRARKAGAAVPDGAMRDAIGFIGTAAEQEVTKPEAIATKAYDLYVLALAGQPRAGANRIMAESPDRLPTPLARAQLAAALALSNDRPRAETLFRAALDAPARRDWDDDRGSALRDQFAIAVLLKESGLLPDRLRDLIAILPGADLRASYLSTQEEAWAAAAAAVLGQDSAPARIAIGGHDEPPAPRVTVVLNGPVTARNLAQQAVWQTVSTSGVPTVPAAAMRSGMRITRQFYGLSGDTIDPGHLPQNTVFILLLEGRADDGQDHRAMLLQGLPAGWEIAGRLGAGKTPGMAWLGELSTPDAQPAADDRYAATVRLTKDQPSFRLAVRLRAVTPGQFEIPGAQLSDMYRPGVFAQQGANRIEVLAQP